jgi:hypothetical protein
MQLLTAVRLLIIVLFEVCSAFALAAPASAEEHATVEADPSWGFIGMMELPDGHYCTVSLVAKSAVLTAGHCVAGRHADEITVHLGGISRDTQWATRKVVGFAQKGVAVDAMTIMYLDAPVENTHVLRLPSKSEGTLWATNSRPRSYGWGRLSANVHSSAELRYSTLKVLDTTVSLSVYHGMLKSGRTEPSGGNPADGDSGGPLVAFDASGEAVQIGVFSSGLPTGAYYFMKTGPNHDWLAEHLST